MGDQIYMLLFAKKLGTKEIYLDWEQKSGQYVRDGYITQWKGKFNKTSAEFLLPLFQHQSYIEKAELYEDNQVDVHYGEWDAAVPLHSGTNLLDFHATKFDIHWEELTEPWLKAPAYQDRPLKDIKVVISRTPRYQGNPNFYKNFLTSLDPSKCLFVGLANEYEDFASEFNFPLNFYQAKDAIDLASVIDSAPMFLGNQSMSCAIAKGLGKLSFVELGRSSANYVFHFNKETHYF